VFAVLLTAILLVPPLLSISCAGSKTILHPITESDIKFLKAGDNFSAPKDGAFLSDFYLNEVMEAKVK
jgi:hypothetical protein